MRIILASQSPRRIELLKNITSDFDVIPADIEENHPNGMPLEEIPVYLAGKKAHHISKKYPDCTVIGCDTGVFIDNTMLGKPKDENDAFKMLSQLSSHTHKVITGCAIYQNSVCKASFSEETLVTFSSLSDRQIKDYIATSDPMDKAGAYGIQGKGSVLIEKINGDFYTVMGLPLCRLNKELSKLL